MGKHRRNARMEGQAEDSYLKHLNTACRRRGRRETESAGRRNEPPIRVSCS